MLAGPFFFGVSKASFASADSLQIVVNGLIAEGEEMNMPTEVMTAARTIGRVYVDNYDEYVRAVYPQVQEDMAPRLEQLSREMKDKSLVKDWERVTGYAWHRGDWIFSSPCSAMSSVSS